MRYRHITFIAIAAALAATPVLAQVPPAPPRPPAAPRAPEGRYQGGPEQTDRFSRKVKLGRQGAFSVGNIAGDIVVTGGSGDEVTIEAVKRARGERAQLDNARITVDERPGRVDVRTEYDGGRIHGDRMVAVDYTITVPSDATVELRSISGDVRVTGVQGMVRAESVSGNVVATKTPRLDRAKSVSGDVELTDVSSDSDMTAGSVSGSLHARGLKTRSLDLNTVSGDVTLTAVTCERVGIRSVSGNIEYEGPLAKSGRYEMNSHSGNVRLLLTANTGFELNASSFSGSIRSDVPLTVGGTGSGGSGAGSGSGSGGDGRDIRRHGMGQAIRATYGDGSALLTIRTFSGDVVIAKK